MGRGVLLRLISNARAFTRVLESDPPAGSRRVVKAHVVVSYLVDTAVHREDKVGRGGTRANISTGPTSTRARTRKSFLFIVFRGPRLMIFFVLRDYSHGGAIIETSRREDRV